MRRVGTSRRPGPWSPALVGALLAGLLVAAVLAAYVPVLGAGFIWNDDTYLTANRTLDGPLRLIWTDPSANEQYYPLVFTSFWLEKRLWGLAPSGYHLVNVLLHAGSALLLWRLLLRLALPGAWLAAATFALHPLCVESVAWVSERKNTLSLFLSLLAILAYLASRGESEEEEEEKEKEKEKIGGFLGKGKRERAQRSSPAEPPSPAARRPLLSFIGFFFFLLALFAKTTAAVVPAVVLVLLWWREGRLKSPDVRRLVPWFAAGILLGAHTAWLERTHVRAVGAEWALGAADRLALAGQVCAFYAAKFFLPVRLAFVYERWPLDPRALVSWLPAAAAAALTAAAWFLRDRAGRGPFAALLLYFGVLFPAMGFVNVYPMRFSWVADHFAYQAVAALAAAVVCGGATLAAGAPAGRRRALCAAAGLGVVALSFLTFRRGRAYENEEILWKDTLSKNPSCFVCETNYGIWLLARGRVDEAAAHLEASRRLKPGEVPTLLNLARIDELRGRFDEAAATLREARRVEPDNAAVLINLANMDARAARVEEAIASYREALRIGSPVDHLAHNGLGAALMRAGNPAEAIAHFREALRLKPGYASAQANLERALRTPPESQGQRGDR